jgi:hypothetical protein
MRSGNAVYCGFVEMRVEEFVEMGVETAAVIAILGVVTSGL